MHLHTGILGSLVIGICLCASLAGAGSAGGGKGDDKPAPKAGRLGVPANVSCSKVGDQVLLS